MDGSTQLPFEPEPADPDRSITTADSVESVESKVSRPEPGLRSAVPPSGPHPGPETVPDAGPAPPSTGPDGRTFQASAGIQGRQFAEQCDTLLGHLGFRLEGRRVLTEVGVEIDQQAVSPRGVRVWFEYKGSVQGHRPGLRRTDTLKKAVANGALLRGLEDPAPYIVITSHLPTAGSGAAMLRTATDLGYFADVICLYDPGATARLRTW